MLDNISTIQVVVASCEMFGVGMFVGSENGTFKNDLGMFIMICCIVACLFV